MVAIVTMLCVTLSVFTINVASHNTHDQFQASHQLANGYQLDHPALPRKLTFNHKIESYEAKDMVSSIGQNIASTDESYKEEKEENVMMHAAKGTRQEWMEGPDPTHEFFTMDYSHVRRRRPIHNKSYRETVTNSP